MIWKSHNIKLVSFAELLFFIATKLMYLLQFIYLDQIIYNIYALYNTGFFYDKTIYYSNIYVCTYIGKYGKELPIPQTDSYQFVVSSTNKNVKKLIKLKLTTFININSFGLIRF